MEKEGDVPNCIKLSVKLAKLYKKFLINNCIIMVWVDCEINN